MTFLVARVVLCISHPYNNPFLFLYIVCKVVHKNYFQQVDVTQLDVQTENLLCMPQFLVINLNTFFRSI